VRIDISPEPAPTPFSQARTKSLGEKVKPGTVEGMGWATTIHPIAQQYDASLLDHDLRSITEPESCDWSSLRRLGAIEDLLITILCVLLVAHVSATATANGLNGVIAVAADVTICLVQGSVQRILTRSNKSWSGPALVRPS